MEVLKLAAQSVMPRLNIDEYDSDKKYKQDIIDLVRFGVCGFCIFKGETQRTRIILQELQSYAEMPLIFSADFEIGLAQRLTEGTEFPHPQAIALSKDKEYAYKIGKAIAKESKDIGVHWVFAPVCDVNTNIENPIINIRAFGSEPKIVSEYADEFIKGVESEKILACAKHFPGHGDASIDSHKALPVLDKTKESWIRDDIPPFESAIKLGVHSIMTAHLLTPAFKENDLPASLSYSITTDLLKNDLGYEGIIITDALEMKAVSEMESVVLKSIQAGATIALMPLNPMQQIEELTRIVENDKELLELLENNFRLIKNAKRWCGLLPYFAKMDGQEKIFDEHPKLALKCAYYGTRVTGNKSILPISDEKTFAGFALLEENTNIRNGSRFFTMLAQAQENECDFGFIDTNISDEEISELKKSINDAEFLIFAVYFRTYLKDDKLARIMKIINDFADGRDVYIINFGNPINSESLPGNVKISTSSDSFASLAAAVAILSGRGEAIEKYY